MSMPTPENGMGPMGRARGVPGHAVSIPVEVPASSAQPENIRKARVFGEQNQAAAEIILADVEKYGGESGAMVTWARKQTEPAK